MNSKRIISLLAAAVLAISVTGCADSSGGNKDSGKAADTQSAQAEVEDKDAPEVPVDSTFDENLPQVAFSLESGFYDSEQSLELSAGDGMTIRYTTDGSLPTASSQEYTEAIRLTDCKGDFATLAEHRDITANGDYNPPMNVLKGNVIRAAAFDDKGSHGQVISHTFFVGIDRKKKYGDVPVISIMIDQSDLFDYDKGIYTLGRCHDEWLAEDKSNASLDGWKHEANYTQRGREWERPVYVEYLLPDGTSAFAQDMGVRTMGAASRNEYQKSLRLTARKEYGEKNVSCEIIPDNARSDGNGNVEKYKSFVLRNGGNDCNFAKIRDPLLQSMISDKTSLETQQFTPVVAFIDGEYWGMYTLVEDYSDNYIANNYDIDNKNVVMLKCGEIEEGEEDDIKLYSDMYEFITSNDMSDADNYAKACDMIDVRNLADYMAFNIYIANEDSIVQGNNWRMWRVRDGGGAADVADGRWRMMVYDTDYSCGIYAGGQNYDSNFIKKAISATETFKDLEQPPIDIFRSLMNNDDFKQMFILSLCDMRNISFEKGKVDDAFDDMSALYKPLVKDTFTRFGPKYAKDGLDYNTMLLRDFLDGRYDVFMYHITDSFKPGNKVNVTVKTSDSAKGGAVMNTTSLDLSSDFSGEYYTAYPITLTADPKAGKFVRWEADGAELSDPDSDITEVTLSADCTITAVYE